MFCVAFALIVIVRPLRLDNANGECAIIKLIHDLAGRFEFELSDLVFHVRFWFVVVVWGLAEIHYVDDARKGGGG